MPKKQKTFRRRGDQGLATDPISRKILTLLKEDSQISYAELGKKIHLSPPAVYERVRRLEQAGIIRGRTVAIDPIAIGLPFCAFVRITTTCGQCDCEDIARALAENPAVEECHSIAGEDNMLIKVRTTSPADLENLLRKIREVPGIEKTLSTVVLRTRFERGIQIPSDPESDTNEPTEPNSLRAKRPH